MCNEQYTRSKEKLQNIRRCSVSSLFNFSRTQLFLFPAEHDLSSLSLVDEKDSDSSLASTAEKFVGALCRTCEYIGILVWPSNIVHIQQQQIEFWNDHHETLQHSMQKYKENAIDSIQQIQLCLNERYVIYAMSTLTVHVLVTELSWLFTGMKCYRANCYQKLHKSLWFTADDTRRSGFILMQVTSTFLRLPHIQIGTHRYHILLARKWYHRSLFTCNNMII
jgi:hypothetical protein